MRSKEHSQLVRFKTLRIRYGAGGGLWSRRRKRIFKGKLENYIHAKVEMPGLTFSGKPVKVKTCFPKSTEQITEQITLLAIN